MYIFSIILRRQPQEIVVELHSCSLDHLCKLCYQIEQDGHGKIQAVNFQDGVGRINMLYSHPINPARKIEILNVLQTSINVIEPLI